MDFSADRSTVAIKGEILQLGGCTEPRQEILFRQETESSGKVLVAGIATIEGICAATRDGTVAAAGLKPASCLCSGILGMKISFTGTMERTDGILIQVRHRYFEPGSFNAARTDAGPG